MSTPPARVRRFVSSVTLNALLITQLLTGVLPVHVAPIAPEVAHATGGQCSDGIDNDGDGLVDALIEGVEPTGDDLIMNILPWGGPQWVNIQINNLGLTHPPLITGNITNGATALRRDGPTALIICQMFGYDEVASTSCNGQDGRCNYSSPGNNFHMRWTGTAWQRVGASGGQWMQVVRCRNRVPECRDGLDNDGDGQRDFGADSGCASEDDQSERQHDPDCEDVNDPSESPECSDGQDNDDDDLTDLDDPGCSSPTDNDESDGTSQCQDGQDNDNDGARDYPDDFSCSSPTDNDEENPKSACQDGQDNDGDGFTDLDDPGCRDEQDNDETKPGGPACDDGEDNDGDGLIDVAGDPGCDGPLDTTETDPNGPACDNGDDDDNDGFTDLDDPGCSGPTDTTETDPNGPACDNGRDDDNDTLTDMADPGCSDPTDMSEKDPNGAQCDNGLDDDGDNEADFPNDAGCDDAFDTDESDDPGPEFNISKSDGTSSVTAGTNTTYTITIENIANESGDDIEILDTLPRGTTFVSADNGGSLSTSNSDLFHLYYASNGIHRNFSQVFDEKWVLGDANGGSAWYFILPNGDLYQWANENPVDLNVSTQVASFNSNRWEDLNRLIKDTNEQVVSWELDFNRNQTRTVSVTVEVDSGTAGTITNRASVDIKTATDTNTVDAPVITACNDGQDNDGDNLVDDDDPGCSDPTDTTETDPNGPACDNGIDDDGDNLIDVADDPGCSDVTDTTETDPNGPACDNGIDDDGDNLVDVADDPGCSDVTDTTETDPNGPACDNGIDDDGDNLIDVAQDPGCSDVTDTTETDPNGPACDNGTDDDGDGLTDVGEDPGCSDVTDTTETDPNGPECDNGLDDDGDNLVDVAQDPDCSDATDDDEGQPAANLSITKTDGETSIAPGEETTYIIDVFNSSNFASNTVEVIDILPRGTTFVSADNGGSLSTSNSDLFHLYYSQSGIFFNASGLDEKWLLGDTNGGSPWYFILPNGDLYQWATESPADPNISTRVASFNSNRWDDLNRLIKDTNEQVVSWDISVSANSSRTLRVTVSIDNDATGTLTNRASVGTETAFDNDTEITATECNDGIDNDGDGNRDDQDAGCDSPSDTDEGDGDADLSVTISTPSGTVAPGETVLYTVTVTNNGPDAVTTIPAEIQIPVPIGVSFNTQQSPGCSESNNLITCDVAQLMSGDSQTFTIGLDIPANVAYDSNLLQQLLGVEKAFAMVSCGGSLITTVTVVSVQDPVTGNNTASTTVTVSCSTGEFSISKDDGETKIRPHENLTYTITVENEENFAVDDVLIVDTFPSDTTFISASNGGSVVSGPRSDLGLYYSQEADHFFDWGGRQELWIQGNRNSGDTWWYFITPDGTLYQWDNSPSTNLTGDFIVSLGSSYYNDLATLIAYGSTQVQWVLDFAARETKTLHLTVLVLETPDARRLQNHVQVNDEIAFDVTSILTECNDRIDNDGDGRRDFEDDPGCEGENDNDEDNGPPQCETRIYDASLGTRPQSQGWSVSSTGPDVGTVSNVFTDNGIDYVRITDATDNGAICLNQNDLDRTALADNDWTLEMVARIVDSSPAAGDGVGVHALIGLPGQHYVSVYIDEHEFGPINEDQDGYADTHSAITTDGFHTYRIQHKSNGNGASDDTFDVYFDNVLVIQDIRQSEIYSIGNGIDAWAEVIFGIISREGTGIMDVSYVEFRTAQCLTPTADLDIEKTGPTTVNAGDTVTYTITVRNNSNTTAQNVYVSDSFRDAGNNRYTPFSFLSANGASCTFEPTGGGSLTPRVRCNLGNMAPFSSQTYTVTYQTPTNTYCGESILNNADVHETPASSSSDWDDHSVTVLCPQADLDVTKTGPAEITAGDDITYTLSVTNRGAGTAQDVIVTDVFESTLHGDHLPYQLISWTGANSCYTDLISVNAPRIVCTFGDLSPGEQRDFTLTFSTHTLNCDQDYTNRADAAEQPATGSSDTARHTVHVRCQTDLDVQKTGPTTVNAGDTITYTIRVENNSSGIAQNVYVSDSFRDAGNNRYTPFSFLSANGASCTFEPAGGGSLTPRVRCELGDMAPWTSQTYTVTYQTPANTHCDESIRNNADVHEDPATNSSDWDDHSVVVRCPVADLDITKTGPATVTAGNTVTYDITIQNNGQGIANDVYTVDSFLDASNNLYTPFTFISASGASCVFIGGVAPRVRCDFGDLNPGETRNFSLTFQTPADTYCNEDILNNVDIHETPNANSSDWDDHSVRVLCPVADLDITKTGPATVNAGDTITYSFTVENNGAGLAHSVYVADFYRDINGNRYEPFTFLSSTGASCSMDYASGTRSPRLVCNLGDLAAGDREDFTVTFGTAANTHCGETIRNDADVHENPSTSSSDSAHHDVQVICPQGSLAATKYANRVTVSPHDEISYTITVHNDGAAPVYDVNMIDVIHADLVYIDGLSDARCDQVANHVECGPIAQLNPGQSVHFTLVFDVLDTAVCGGTISNVADVTALNVAPLWSNQVDLPVVCPDPEIVVTKIVDKTVANPGDSLTYTIDIDNAGSATAEDILVLDDVPEHLTFDSLNSDPLCFLQSGTIRCNIGDLPEHTITSVPIVFTIDNDATCGEDIENVADVVGDNFPLERSNTVSTRIECLAPDLEVEKFVDKAIAQIGDTLFYDIDVLNTGAGTAFDVELVDAIPFGLTFEPGLSTPGCVQIFSSIHCDAGDMISGQLEQFTLAFTVNGQARCDEDIQNFANVSATNHPTVWSDFAYTRITCPTAILSATKEVDRTLAGIGDDIAYTITVENLGTADAENVTIVDPIPNHVTFDPSNSDNDCTQILDEIICTNGTLAVGDTETFILTFTVDNDAVCADSINNAATISADNYGDVTTDTVSTVVSCSPPNLITEKEVDLDTVERGDILIYTLRVENTGQGTAENVVFEDVIPDDLSFIPHQSDPFCDEVAGTIYCGPIDLPGSTFDRFRLAFEVEDTAACGDDIFNSASVESDQTGVVFTNSVSTEVLCPVFEPDLILTKNVDTLTAEPGDLIEYEIIVENDGAGTAFDVEITDAIPSGLTFNPADSDPACRQIVNVIHCDAGDLLPNEFEVFVLSFKVNISATCNDDIDNIADASASNHTIVWSNEVSTYISCPAPTLSAEKTVDRTLAEHGDRIVYTITVDNTGSADADNIVVTDIIPDHLTYDPAVSDVDCDEVSGEIICTNGTLRAGDSESFRIVFTLDNTAPCGHFVDNYAVIGADNYADVHTGTVTTTVSCGPPNLVLEKTANTDAAERGDQLVYTLHIENTGQTEAENVILTDTIPAGLDFIAHLSDPYCSESAGVITCGPINLPDRTFDSFRLVFEIRSDAACNEDIINEATARADNASSITSDPVSTTVVCLGADILAEKFVDLSDIPGTGISQLTYEIVVTNTGYVPLTDVEVLDDALPLGLGMTFRHDLSDARCAQIGTSIECSGGDIAVGDSDTYTIIVDVDGAAFCGTDIENEAAVNTDETALTYTKQVSTNVGPCVDPALSINKTANRTTVGLNETIGYTFTVQNTVVGTTATNVIVTDDVAPGLTFLPGSSDSVCSENNGVVTCDTGDLDGNDVLTAFISLRVDDDSLCGQTINNQGVADADNADPILSNSVAVTVACKQADLSLVKEGPDTVIRGETVTYTLTATNAGSSAVTDAAIYDDVPLVLVENTTNYAYLVFDDAASDPACDLIGATIVCEPISLDVNETKNFDLVFSVPSSAACGATVENIAFIASLDTDDPDVNNNIDNALTTVECSTGTPEITKSGPAAAEHGDTITYTVTVTNDLGFDLSNLEMVDAIPSHLQYVSANDNLCYVEYTTDEVVCGPFNLANGASRSFELTFTVLNTAACNADIVNVADIYPENADPGFSNAVSTDIVCTPSFTITKTDDRTTAMPSDTLTYVIEVTNTSNVLAQDVEIIDTLPSAVTFLSANATGADSITQQNGVVTTIIDIPAGQSITININGQVLSTAADNTVLTNTATVTGGPSATDTTTVDIVTPTYSITKDVDHDTADVDDELRYTMVITNTSTANATNVAVTDTLPTDLTYLSSSDGGTVSGQTVSWSFNLNAGESETFTVDARVKNTADDGDVLTNTVRITSTGQTSTATTRIEEDRGEITISISDDPDPVNLCREREVDYSITIDNSTDQNERVDITAHLDDDMEFISASNDGDEEGSDEVEWRNLTVNRNSSREVRLRVRITDNRQVELRANIRGGDSDTERTDVRDGSCGGGIIRPPVPPPVVPVPPVTGGPIAPPVGTSPGLSISKTASVTEAQPGNVVSYTVTIRNTSSADIQNATLVDSFPAGRLLIEDPGGGSLSASQIQWNLGALRAGSTTVVRYRARLSSSLRQGDTIRNTATVTGNGISRSDSHQIVIPVPPQTGLTGFIKGLTQNEEHVRPANDKAVEAATPLSVLIFMTTILTGLGVGSMFGRRLLLP